MLGVVLHSQTLFPVHLQVKEVQGGQGPGEPGLVPLTLSLHHFFFLWDAFVHGSTVVHCWKFFYSDFHLLILGWPCASPKTSRIGNHRYRLYIYLRILHMVKYHLLWCTHCEVLCKCLEGVATTSFFIFLVEVWKWVFGPYSVVLKDSVHRSWTLMMMLLRLDVVSGIQPGSDSM